MNWFFDAVIFGFLALDSAFIVWLWRRGESFLKPFIHYLLMVLAVIAWAVIAYGSFFEPRQIVVRPQDVAINENPTNTLVAAVIADLHVGPYKNQRFVQQVIEHLVVMNPDVVLIAGDFVYDDASQAIELEPFKHISQVYPVYAVLGNHDYDLGSDTDPADEERAGQIEARLRSYGIEVLNNSGVLIEGYPVWLAGIEDIWSDRASIDEALRGRPLPPPPTILLTHNPDTVFTIRPAHDIDLMIAGHTHGGQIRLPLIGPVPEIPDQLGRNYDKGLFTIEGVQTFITSGLGESGPRARLFNFPEIVQLSIHY